MAAQQMATLLEIVFGKTCCFICRCPPQKWKDSAPPVEHRWQYGLKQNSAARNQKEIAGRPRVDPSLKAFSTQEASKNIEAWCKHGSWAMCEQCFSMEPRPLQPIDTQKLHAPTIKRCKILDRYTSTRRLRHPSRDPINAVHLGPNVVPSTRRTPPPLHLALTPHAVSPFPQELIGDEQRGEESG